MERRWLGFLLLLLLSACPATDPQIEEVKDVASEEPTAERMSFADACWIAWELEVQEGLGRTLARKTWIPEKEALEIVRIAYRESTAHGINVFRTLGFIVAESHAKKRAVSYKGARGLMQIMPQTGRYIAAALGEPWKGKTSLFDIELNIRYGVWYYKELLETFDGDETAAIAAYNWGPPHIAYRIRKERTLPKEYPYKVLKAEEEIRKEFSNENRDLIWRSYSRAERIIRDRRDPGQPENRANLGSFPGAIQPGP